MESPFVGEVKIIAWVKIDQIPEGQFAEIHGFLDVGGHFVHVWGRIRLICSASLRQGYEYEYQAWEAWIRCNDTGPL